MRLCQHCSLPLLVCLIIDGNNLAHALYPDLAANSKLHLKHYQRLIRHLDSYHHNHPECAIELCFDGTPHEAALPHRIDERYQVYFPLGDRRKKADHLIQERCSYQLYQQQPCLVITNDGLLTGAVRALHGKVLLVDQFVRRAGSHNPVFRAPGELPAGAVLPKAPAETAFTVSQISIRESRARPARQIQLAHPNIPPIVKPPQPALAIPPTRVKEPAPVLLERALMESPEPPASPQVRYQLTIANWPAAEGAQFLKEAFCRSHYRANHELITLMAEMGELQELANLLVSTCGAEPDFARRGALLKRVRLALLKAQGAPLDVSEIAAQTGLNPLGLQGRLRKKAGHWFSRCTVEEPAQHPSGSL